MKDYVYDGSFDGLLTVIWHHYYTDRAARVCGTGEYQPSFLCESMEVTTEAEKADRVYKAIRQKISEYDLRGVYRAWLSCDPEKEMKILRYVELGFRQGHRTSSLHSNPVVADFQAILQKISQEAERMLQFVRFSVVQLPSEPVAGKRTALSPATDDRTELESAAGQQMALESAANEGPSDVLYARIEPDNDVIELAGPHFSDRFRNDRVIIHDVGRDKALIAYHGKWIISAFAAGDAPAPSREEMRWRQLWKQYFDHIAIMERKNTRCQNNFIPDRYRKHLTEITFSADSV